MPCVRELHFEKMGGLRDSVLSLINPQQVLMGNLFMYFFRTGIAMAYNKISYTTKVFESCSLFYVQAQFMMV